MSIFRNRRLPLPKYPTETTPESLASESNAERTSVSIIKEVFSVAYTIELNDVPEVLVKQGNGKETLAIRVSDSVAEMVEKAHAAADDSVQAAALETTTPELKIAGTEIPLRYIANEIRNFARVPLLKISGSIFENDADGASDNQKPKKFHLVLHSNDSKESPVSESGPLDDVIKAAALDTLKVVAPITAAGYLRNGSIDEKFEALNIIDKSIIREKDDEESAWFGLAKFWLLSKDA